MSLKYCAQLYDLIFAQRHEWKEISCIEDRVRRCWGKPGGDGRDIWFLGTLLWTRRNKQHSGSSVYLGLYISRRTSDTKKIKESVWFPLPHLAPSNKPFKSFLFPPEKWIFGPLVAIYVQPPSLACFVCPKTMHYCRIRSTVVIGLVIGRAFRVLNTTCLLAFLKALWPMNLGSLT